MYVSDLLYRICFALLLVAANSIESKYKIDSHSDTVSRVTELRGIEKNHGLIHVCIILMLGVMDFLKKKNNVKCYKFFVCDLVAAQLFVFARTDNGSMCVSCLDIEQMKRNSLYFVAVFANYNHLLNSWLTAFDIALLSIV